MTTFALVHGAWHGAWCWERVVPVLESAGHRAVTVDLPCEDPAATFASYAEVVVGALDGETGDVVVVGHSLAGHTIPLVAVRRPVRHLIFVCALVAEPRRSFIDQVTSERVLSAEYDAGLSEPDAEGRRAWVDEGVARRVLYSDCTAARALAAFERLRPQASALYRVPCPLDGLPSTPRTSIVCTEDRMIDPGWSRRAARRVGAELVELPGGHSPFLSRPRDLAAVLVR